jgi:glycerol-3-phosphate dehydrogenase (NAD(P)+)
VRTPGNPSLGTIAVVGAGAWGTALANAAAKAGRNVVLLGRDSEQIRKLARERMNEKYLPGIVLEPRVEPASDFERLHAADAVLLVTPTQSLRAICREIGNRLADDVPVVACSKGIETGTQKFVTEVIAETIPQVAPAILSGPGFADDVGRGLPTAVTLAAHDERVAAALCQALGSNAFRLYHSTDVRGVEIGGAAKNVLAIAAGIVAGKKLGASAQAAMVTRGFAELMRFARASGARPETITGLSGLGDLVLTCSSPQSRNYAFGSRLAQAKPSVDVNGKLVEGVYTAPVLVASARALRVEMPIAEAVLAILSRSTNVDDAIAALLSRPARQED